MGRRYQYCECKRENGGGGEGLCWLHNHMRDVMTEAELSRYQFLRSITDSRRLKEMLPSWCRPKPIPRSAEFVPGLPPRFPAWSFGQTTVAPQIFRFPATDICTNPNVLPRSEYKYRQIKPKEYIKEFDRLNGLKPCPIEWVKVQSFG